MYKTGELVLLSIEYCFTKLVLRQWTLYYS